MKKYQTSVTISNDTVELCKRLSPPNKVNISGSLDIIAERYDYLVTKCMPDLPTNELEILCNLYKDHDFVGDTDKEVNLFYGMVISKLNVKDAYPKCLSDFQNKLINLSYLEKYALIDCIQRMVGIINTIKD
jgi:hypothetical protein